VTAANASATRQTVDHQQACILNAYTAIWSIPKCLAKINGRPTTALHLHSVYKKTSYLHFFSISRRIT